MMDVDNTRKSSASGLIIRQNEPKNLEAPFDQFDSYLTPTELFYIRSHFPAPKLGPRRLSTAHRWCRYTLLARAKDADGKVQPDEHDRNYGTYVINHLLPIEVFVDDSADPRP